MSWNIRIARIGTLERQDDFFAFQNVVYAYQHSIHYANMFIYPGMEKNNCSQTAF